MIVVLAEKPSVARDLARILGANAKHEGYLEGNGYQVTWAFGHLIELDEPESYGAQFKRWSLESLPVIPEAFKHKVASDKGVKNQFATIKKLFRAAETIVCATDAGREGELIFRLILKMCECEKKPAKRLWINSLTDEAISLGFKSLKPLSDFDNLSAAASCRSEADWIVGINATRAYTTLYSRGRGVLSVGRVQTPVLALIVKRDLEIRNFVPEDYWEVWTLYREAKFKHEKGRFDKREKADAVVEKVKPSPLKIVKIEEKKAKQPPPQLFDLTELQRAMNRLHGFTSMDTLKFAQSLYEKKLISYPRTDSRYLSNDIYPQCSATLAKMKGSYSKEIEPLDLSKLDKSKRVFDDKKVSDHHAIIPTGQYTGQLPFDEKKVYDAIAIRFIAVFYPSAEKAHTTVHAVAAEEKFKATGTRILFPGWLTLYQSEKKDKEDEEDEQVLPTFVEGEEGLHVPEVKVCKTKPPKNFNEASLLTAMETAGKSVDDDELKEAMKEKGLGTPATRAGIIETLLKREYISKDKKKLNATAKGEELIAILQDQATLTSPEMTAEWEHSLKRVEKGELVANTFMKEISNFTRQLINDLKGKPRTFNFGKCPLCSSPVIKGTKGWGCSAWKTGCTFRFMRDSLGTQLSDKDAELLMHRGNLPYTKKIKGKTGEIIELSISLDPKTGALKS